MNYNITPQEGEQSFEGVFFLGEKPVPSDSRGKPKRGSEKPDRDVGFFCFKLENEDVLCLYLRSFCKLGLS
jgi:hypothetical protein